MMRRSWPLLLTLAGAGCASVPVRGGFDDVAKTVDARTGRVVRWDQGGSEAQEIRALVHDRLAAPLTLDTAVEIGLLNNRGLQATYEELGIAQADLVQAGLARNPSLSGTLNIPLAAAPIEGEVSLVQDFMDILVLPLRKQLAGVEFERTKLLVGDAVVRFTGELRNAWWSLVVAEKDRQLLVEIVAANDAAAEMAQRRRDAGNMTELDLALEQAPAAESRLALAQAELRLKAERERLITLLGLWGPDTAFRFADDLPPLPAEEAPLDHLESLAIERRLDVAAARKEVASLDLTLTYTSVTRLFPVIALGVGAMQTSPEGTRLVGPTLELELPIFDQGQARVARVEALQRQAQDRLVDLAVRTRSEVRVTRARLDNARRSVEYFRGVVLPLRETVVAQSQLQYNGMQLGPTALLDAKRSQVSAYREYIGYIGQYWMARTDLEVALGGRLDAGPSSESVSGHSEASHD